MASHESRQEKGSSSGYGYSSDISSSSAHHHHHQQHLVNQMQSFESNPELFNLTTGMEMLTFPSKHRDIDGGSNNNHNNNNTNNSVMWKGFYQTSSSNTSPHLSHHHHHHEFNKPDFATPSIGLISESTSGQNLIDSSWQDHTTTATNTNNSNRLMVDDASLRCVFPCEGAERPSQGLSLSLSSNKPSTIGLQSFELRDSNQQDGYFGKSPNFHPHQQQQLHQMFQSSSSSSSLLQLKNSKYLAPTQELLDELCNLGTKTQQKQIKPHKINNNNQLDDENGSGSSRKNSFLYSLDLLELQKRKSKLLSMLEEVDRRYRQYCDQMRGVVSTFEAVVGMGSASVYSTLASKAMSKHFRCLRDGIVDEIKATKKAMGEKEVPIAPGTTKGETPRLRVLDQTLRQQRAFQQMSMLESHPWRPQRGLPERSVSVLRAWLFEHFLHPYPSDVDKHILARQTGLSRSQVSNWFINARVRLWKPMVEEMYLEETKEQETIAAAAAASASSSDWITNLDENPRGTSNHQQLYSRSEDHKPTPDQLIRGDSDQSLSSIINISSTHITDTENTRSSNHHHHQFHHHSQETTHHHQNDHGFGVMNMDFSAGAYNSVMNHHQLIGNGVSLTLGLQQHGGGSGMTSLSFTSPVTVAAQHQHSLYYPRDDHHSQIEDCEQVQYSSILDGEAAAAAATAVHENLPYRNLMGGSAHQLLHDLA